jgi:CRP/FNR family transcriptional regulator, cyclic AMP receptor protein
MASGRAALDLKNIWLFSSCTSSELKKVSRALHEAEVPKGRVLVEEGEMGAYLFIIVSGIAVVTRRNRTVATLGRGDFFGELSLLDRKPRSASVECRTDVEILLLSYGRFSKLLDSAPTVRKKLLDLLASRLRESESLTYL